VESAEFAERRTIEMLKGIWWGNFVMYCSVGIAE
jgi:hypothetical protein